MKISNLIKRSLFIVFSVLSVSNLFAGDIVLLPQDDGKKIPPTQTDNMVFYPVTATEDNSELAVNFEQSVGIATIRVYDSSNQVVCQYVVDTNSQSTLLIDISAWSEGDYTITISYGTTNLIGEFSVE